MTYNGLTVTWDITFSNKCILTVWYLYFFWSKRSEYFLHHWWNAGCVVWRQYFTLTARQSPRGQSRSGWCRQAALVIRLIIGLTVYIYVGFLSAWVSVHRLVQNDPLIGLVLLRRDRGIWKTFWTLPSNSYFWCSPKGRIVIWTTKQFSSFCYKNSNITYS